LTKKLNGEPADDSALGMNLRLVRDAFKAGFFEKAKPSEGFPTQRAINEGFLKDESKLSQLFTPEQIAEINAKTGEKSDKDPTNASRTNAIKRLWASRKVSDKADPYVVATAEAIVNGDTDIKWKSEETTKNESARAWKARADYGRVMDHVTRWAKAHPKATVDDIRKEAVRVAAPNDEQDFLQSAFEGAGFDPEIETGMVLPDLNEIPQ
jgi:hypothetical protein